MAAPAATPAPTRQVQAPRPAPVPTPAPRAEAGGGAGSDDYRVRRGDTLSQIAARNSRSGVSLDQMLVALYRSNPDAFMGENMNRLKAGVVLTVPSAEAASRVTPSDARVVIQAQSADFAAYRQRLASGATTQADGGPSRQSTGSVQAKVDDRRQAAATSPDKLTLSQGGVKAGAPESQISRDAQRKDSATRVAELARNVEDLKRLQQGAAASAAAGPAPAPARAAAPAPAPAATPVVPTPTVVAAAPPAPPPTPAPEPAPAPPPAPASAATPAPAPAPVADEPGFLADVIDTPWALPGAVVLVGLLVGLGLYRARSAKKKAGGETSFLESRLQPDSFFGASGGQRIDTREAAGSTSSTASSSMSYSLSQLDAIGDVDPVAEADVYLAYGRDLQAEEILKEAMRANPQRMAIRTKLLEVYAKRRDIKGFELLASQVHSLTRGEGEDWDKIQEMGQQIDPENLLYQPGGQPEPVRGAGGLPVDEPLGASTMPHTAKAAPDVFTPDPELEAGGGLDLDLGLDDTPPSPVEITRPLQTSADIPHDAPVDFDPMPTLDDATTQPAAMMATPPSDGGLDFDLDSLSLDEPVPKTMPLPRADLGDQGLDFGDFAMAPTEVRTVAMPGAAAESPPIDEDGDPLARKLELAEEFRQIGDVEGARDLLEEVIAKAEGVLKSKAQGMLDDLA
jgi:pilus assembly protein FimV